MDVVHTRPMGTYLGTQVGSSSMYCTAYSHMPEDACKVDLGIAPQLHSSLPVDVVRMKLVRVGG